MNRLTFAGRVAATPTLETKGTTKLTRFRLIRNDYAGTDGGGERREEEVAVTFIAFGGKAETLARTVLIGDQLIVEAHLRNNNYEDGEGVERFGFNFVLDTFEYGAPGAEKRKRLAERQ